MLYQVEVKSLLTTAGYKRLDKYLKRSGKFIGETKEEMIKLASNKGEIKFRKNGEQAKIICAIGEISQGCRPEMEVNCQTKDLDKLFFIFGELGFQTQARWLKKRKIYRWQGTNVYLDNIRGLGLWLEMEKLVDSRIQELARQELAERMNQLLKRLKLPLSSSVDINKKIFEYHCHWTKLINKKFSRT